LRVGLVLQDYWNAPYISPCVEPTRCRTHSR
jgi:hypothetical protein